MPLAQRAVSVLASTAVLATAFSAAAPLGDPLLLPIPDLLGPRVSIAPVPLPALTPKADPVARPVKQAPAAPQASAPSGTDHCSDAGPALRYLVLFDPGTAPSSAADEITANCGDMTVFYQPIGVAVATSPDHRFADKIGRDRAYSAEGEALTDRGVFVQHKHRSMEDAPTMHEPGASGLTDQDRSAEQWDMAMIHAGQAHAVTLGSPDVVVGVLDSGIDADHPELRHAVDPSLSAGCTTGAPDTGTAAWSPTTSSHGTHIAGTIAAADDGHGITGVAPGVRLASVKVVDDTGFIYPESAICGFMWAADHHFSITNNSYFVDPWEFTCRQQPGQRVVYEAMRRAVEYSTRQGVLNVAAVGNEGLDLSDPETDSSSPDNAATQHTRTLGDGCAMLPAQLKGVVAVSSVGAQGVKAGYSSYGLGVADVTAPGGDRGQHPPGAADSCVVSTLPGGYGDSCGTSMAVPHAAGVAALIASTHPGSSPAQLTRLLNADTDPLRCPANYDLNGDGVQDAICDGYSGYNGFYGHGLVDALKAVTR